MLRLNVLLPLLAALLLGLAPQAAADDYPTKPITLIVPFPAGGGVDVIGRIVADKLAAELGQPVVIDNRGGAAGVIGTRGAARAAPDGYTLVMATSGSIAINPNLYANPGYQTLKDLSPVGLISSTPIVLMAHPSAPEQSLGAVIASAKREPGKLNIGTPPPGTSAYLGGELFKSLAGVDITIVTYRGTGPLTTDLLGGHVKLGLNVLAPAGTPRPIIERLNRALRAGVDTADVRARIDADGGDPLPSTPEEYTADIEREDARWGALIRKLNLKVE